MFTLALIGVIGGLISGISSCILPVLPVIFYSGAQSSVDDVATPRQSSSAVATAVNTKRVPPQTLRPYRVIGGLVCSFSVVALAGSALLSLLHLPQDTLRWIALVALAAIGFGLIFPMVEQLLERPFSGVPKKHIPIRTNGFGLGLALGVLYVPCAGPVLATIVVAGASAAIGPDTVVLTCAFAVGAALPLLMFALAGQRIAERISAFRHRQREIRIAAGIVTILLAVALVFNLPAVLQRAIPDYTSSLQNRLGNSQLIWQKLNLGGIINDQNKQLSNCTNGASQLENCGAAPDLKDITGWINTPSDQPINLHWLRGTVVLVDFWAYSCINCQRAIPHLEGWYKAYQSSGFEVVGVHTPEYPFEKVKSNVQTASAELGVTYPIALDNCYSTWANYGNRYWPAEYLIDATGTVRHIAFGEGHYNGTERLIRQLLADATPDIELPAPVNAADTTPRHDLTPETYFGVGKMVNYAGVGSYDRGSATFSFPPALPNDSFALRGPWTLDDQGATADRRTSSVELNYRAKNVYIVIGGTGSITVTRDGTSTIVPISGPPTARQIVAGNDVARGTLDVHPSQGLQVFSFTYG